MTVGSFMGKTFKVYEDVRTHKRKIFTPSNLSGSTGADFATHDRAAKKARTQYLGPKLREYSFDLLLRQQDGVNPRKLKDFFQKKSEKGKADYFIIGGKPLSSNRFVITDVSDEWDVVMLAGALVECKITLKLQEYL